EEVSAFTQIAGALCFNVGCLTASWGDEWAPETYTFWSIGSALFTVQSLIIQILCVTFWGSLLPIWPTPPTKFPCTRKFCFHHCIPAAALNTLGGILFIAG